ncbi:PQQ-binding-like beta-propeller repeat protein [Streptomyces spiramyceticus]|uniref:outer membrane protein assembly factor BamB family protein n=1 Tax=Streptomyces spiramyceticus TaxID=299717 RepID=UPI003B75B62E
MHGGHADAEEVGELAVCEVGAPRDGGQENPVVQQERLRPPPSRLGRRWLFSGRVALPRRVARRGKVLPSGWCGCVAVGPPRSPWSTARRCGASSSTGPATARARRTTRRARCTRRWTATCGRTTLKLKNTSDGFGCGVVHGKTLYVANDRSEVYAVDTATGSEQWKRATEYPGRSTPAVVLSGAGRTVRARRHAGHRVQRARRSAAVEFQDAGAESAAAPAGYRAQTSGSTAVLWRGRNLYALPLN